MPEMQCQKCTSEQVLLHCGHKVCPVERDVGMKDVGIGHVVLACRALRQGAGRYLQHMTNSSRVLGTGHACMCRDTDRFVSSSANEAAHQLRTANKQ